MNKNFRVRIIVGLGMFIVALISMYTFDEIPFKIIFGLFAMLAAIELFSFFQRRKTVFLWFLALIELIFLVCSIVFVAKTDLSLFWYVVLGVPGYDIFAFVAGKLIGGKLFHNSRPFPHISKNKTWEGTIVGLAASFLLVTIRMATRGAFETEYIYLFCGPLALAGDLFESFLKRQFDIKDSNEILIKNMALARLEILVGGNEGHGGFLDRIDSVAFASTVLLMLGYMVK